MALNSMRLDRFLVQHCRLRKRAVQLILAQRRVQVDGISVDCGNMIINHFSHICLDHQPLQAHQGYYLMLNKPVGVVSATQDQLHKTVIDLLDYSYKSQLHIVGRLDLNSSGLLLFSNDSRWSKQITEPKVKVPKRYLVTLAKPITPDYVAAFADGMYFSYENITTMPAQVTILSDYSAEVVLYEGKYHQLKRMFGRFRNKVLSIHRLSVGKLKLDDALKPGANRLLTADEVMLFNIDTDNTALKTKEIVT